MAGLVAVLSPDVNSSRELAAAVLSRLAAPGDAGSGLVSSGVAVLGQARRPGTLARPEVALPLERGGRVLVAELRLDERAALASELGADPGAPDAELVLRAHERWGSRAPAHLAGEFAYVLWDPEREELHAARSPFGPWPIFHGRTPRGLVLASEARAVAEALGRVELEPGTVLDFLEGGARDVSRTFFRGVARLGPGHALVATRTTLREERFFEPPRTVLRLGRRACDRAFLELLECSVAARLETPGPLLCHLSGGLDSSSIACLAERLARRGSRPPLRLVSAAYPGLPCDETAFQDAVLGKVRFPHERYDGTRVSALEAPGRDHPFRPAQPDATAGWRAIAAREGARVVLSGFGGDELLFERGVFRDLAARGQLVSLLREAWLAPRYSSRTTGSILRDALSVLVPARVRRRRRPAAGAAPAWLGPGLRDAWDRRTRSPGPEDEQGFRSHVARWTWRWLTGAPLVWHLELEGALAARHGLEVRYPFLDARLARFVLSLPPERRLPGGEMKRLLRTALAGVLPREIRRRRGVTRFDPVIVLQGREALSRARALLAGGAWASEGFVLREGFRGLVEGFASGGSAEDARLLGALVDLEAWLRG